VKFEIKCRFTAKILFECEAVSIAAAVSKAVEMKANLRSADLSSANLRSADLRYADLSSANLSYANLRYADLSSADLSSANLSYANLRSADLRYADLSSANLSYANLRYADLSSANLSSANLSSANLRSADLSSAKDDLLEKLSKAKSEAIGLFKALVDGKIDGSCYTGECACFCGTIANVKGIDYREMEKAMGITPNGSSPVEVWFANINKGDTPENSQVSAITKSWMEEFFKANEITPPTRQVMWI
jgi:hypothetical protein